MGQEAKEIKQDVVVVAQEFELPSEDIHALKISDVVDLGKQKSPFGDKLKLRIVMSVMDQKGENGDELRVVQQHTQSLHPKSGLFAFLAELGLDPSVKKFNVSKLVGTTFSAYIEHVPSKDKSKTYANLGSIQKKTIRLSPALIEVI